MMPAPSSNMRRSALIQTIRKVSQFQYFGMVCKAIDIGLGQSDLSVDAASALAPSESIIDALIKQQK